MGDGLAKELLPEARSLGRPSMHSDLQALLMILPIAGALLVPMASLLLAVLPIREQFVHVVQCAGGTARGIRARVTMTMMRMRMLGMAGMLLLQLDLVLQGHLLDVPLLQNGRASLGELSSLGSPQVQVKCPTNMARRCLSLLARTATQAP